MIARTEKTVGFRPRLVLAYADTARAALSSRYFRRLGWEVHQASSGPEAHRLARALRPQVVILDAELRGESGWLTCAKLTFGNRDFKVVLLTDEVTPQRQRFAEMVGAAVLLPRGAGLTTLIEEVHDTTLCTAG